MSPPGNDGLACALVWMLVAVVGLAVSEVIRVLWAGVTLVAGSL